MTWSTNHCRTGWKAFQKQYVKVSQDITKLFYQDFTEDEIDLFELIEDTDKAIIVGENLCFGIRYEGNEIRSKYFFISCRRR